MVFFGLLVFYLIFTRISEVTIDGLTKRLSRGAATLVVTYKDKLEDELL